MDLFEMIHRGTSSWNNKTIGFEYNDRLRGQRDFDVHVYGKHMVIFVKRLRRHKDACLKIKII